MGKFKRKKSGQIDDGEEGLLKLENQQLKAKIANLEKSNMMQGNEYNPEFLKLQTELDAKEAENWKLQQRITELQGSGGFFQEQSDFINSGQPMNTSFQSGDGENRSYGHEMYEPTHGNELQNRLADLQS